jgi:propanol-preferring alcohol dehydrogenase
MKAMLISKISNLKDNPTPLEFRDVPRPEPGEGEVLLKVLTCAVCHTDMDEVEGRTPPPHLPVVPGHQVIGRVEKTGTRAGRFQTGERVGVAWIFSACGRCRFCRSGRENLCADFKGTGRDANGGYAEYMTVPEDFAYPIPAVFGDAEAAPLLCAGAVGYRALKLSGIADGENLGLTGFGASGHLVLQTVVRRFPKARIYVFARAEKEREFALELGAAWAGDTGDRPPEKLWAIIDTTPVWKPVVEALGNLAPGGRLVVNAIRKEDVDKGELLRLDYAGDLWLEKEIKSVANVTRADVAEFLALAADVPLRPEVEEYPLEEANRALVEIKERRIRGAKVLRIS